MEIVVHKNETKEQFLKRISRTVDLKSKKGAMLKSFGNLQRGLDGVEYQRKMRDDEWS